MENIMTRKLTPEEQNQILYALFGYKVHLVTGVVYDSEGDDIGDYDLTTLSYIFRYAEGVYRDSELSHIKLGFNRLLNR